jgi:hypothetical protein
MDRRSEHRFDSDKPVRVTLLGAEPRTFDGRVVNFSGRGMRLSVDEAVPPRGPVRVDWGDSILVGEICYVAEADGKYAVGLLLDRALKHLTELTHLAEAILDTQPASAPHPPTLE